MSNENTPNSDENGLRYEDIDMGPIQSIPDNNGPFWTDLYLEPSTQITEWLNRPSETMDDILTKPPSSNVRHFIEMALNPSDMSATNRMVILDRHIKWVDESE